MVGKVDSRELGRVLNDLLEGHDGREGGLPVWDEEVHVHVACLEGQTRVR